MNRSRSNSRLLSDTCRSVLRASCGAAKRARAFALILIYTALAVVIVFRLHRYGKLK